MIKIFKNEIIAKISMFLWRLKIFSINVLGKLLRSPEGNKYTGRNAECKNESRQL